MGKQSIFAGKNEQIKENSEFIRGREDFLRENKDFGPEKSENMGNQREFKEKKPVVEKKTSLNLFENDSMPQGEENLLVFSPMTGANEGKFNVEADGEFKLDEELAGKLTGEQIAEMKKEFVRQKVENKVSFLCLFSRNFDF